MKGPTRIRAACLVALAAVGVVVFTACEAKVNEPASGTTPSSSVQPTSKATLPGPNNFSPAPIAPLSPTANPGYDTAQHP
jgi:hypothetical protein